MCYELLEMQKINAVSYPGSHGSTHLFVNDLKLPHNLKSTFDMLAISAALVATAFRIVVLKRWKKGHCRCGAGDVDLSRCRVSRCCGAGSRGEVVA